MSSYIHIQIHIRIFGWKAESIIALIHYCWH